MTIIVPPDYHLRQALQERRILCVDARDALREDIRALRIGILNVMPLMYKSTEIHWMRPEFIAWLLIPPWVTAIIAVSVGRKTG